MWDSEDTAAPAEVLLLALELPGNAAGWEGGKEGGREGAREGGRERCSSAVRAGGAPTAVPADGPASAASPLSALLHV